MEKHVWSVCLGVAAVLADAAALATGTGEAGSPAEEPDDAVVLGEEDLADRAEILRNMYRRITPPDSPLVQDVGTWPAAWEEFGANWDAAAADREYGAWVVPVEMSQDAGLTVVKDGDGTVLWHGWTDFARPESADVVLTGGLVAEEDWAAYEGVRDAVAAMRDTAGGTPAPPVMRTTPTNGLRFTAHEWTTNGTFRLELAYEIDTNVDIFAYAVACTSSLVVATWTNDENQVVTDTNTVWTSVGLPFNGMESDWELRGTVAISNGVAEFEDSGFSEELSRLRFYAAAVAEDTDGDGLNDGWEDFVSHTDPSNQDSDGDGVPDGQDTMPATSNVWFEVVTSTNLYYQMFLGNCPSNALRRDNENWVWNISGNAPTPDSVVSNVWVSGHVDDIISVDGTDVDSNRGPTNYYHQRILNLIDHPESHAFQLKLWDHPATNYAGPNEVSLGTSSSDPFVIEWTWLVPMSVTGPECVCVGDAVQFEAGGAGGGPYTWSVTYEGTTPVGEIDEDGVFTALAPGIATVTATAGEVYAVSQAVNVVQIDFLVGGGNMPASELKIAKWENAFTMVGTNVSVKENFIDLDPDRFRVRVTDLSQTGAGIIQIGLSTISPYPPPNDDLTGIELHEEPFDSGTFLSTNQLLVVDDIDDDFSNSQVPDDDAGNDRTHRVSARGKVHVRYPWTGAALAEKEIGVRNDKTVHVIPIIMRVATTNGLDPVMTAQQVHQRMDVARQRYAQVGVDLTWSEPEICDQPEGVDLLDGLLVRASTNSHVLAVEARSAIIGVGTYSNTTSIHLIYVNRLVMGDGDQPDGTAVASYWYYPPSEANYLNNIFMSSDLRQGPERDGCVIAHELGHLLGNNQHNTQETWRLMYEHIKMNGAKGSRRFGNQEESNIRGDSHVHENEI